MNFARLNSLSDEAKTPIDRKLRLQTVRYRCFSDIPINDRFNNTEKFNELKSMWRDRMVRQRLQYVELLEIQPRTFYNGNVRIIAEILKV